MGTNTSKYSNDVDVTAQKINPDGIVTSDPRSPTPEIVRTPLQGKTERKRNITKNADLSKTLGNAPEQSPIYNNPILSAVIKNHLQSFDPRSPTQDFDRTPIVISSNVPVPKSKLQVSDDYYGISLKETPVDDDLDATMDYNQYNSEMVQRNLCDGFFDTTLNNTSQELEEPLGSSTASHDTIEKNISPKNNSTPTILLETNFDYVENECDTNERQKLTTNNQNIYVQGYLGNVKTSKFEILENDPRSPTVGIERTPIVVTKVEETYDLNVESMSDESLLKALHKRNSDFIQTLSLVKDKDKDGLLIYEDESLGNFSETPRKVPDINNGARTPLSCMKNKTETTHTRSKSANTLITSTGKNVQSPKHVSHIPRLKSLSKNRYSHAGSLSSLKSISKASAISGDCENTPPHTQRDIWDKDNSVVL